MYFFLKTPQEISINLAERMRDLRLLKKWKRSTLAKRSGVTESSLRRFEQTGKVSMENFLKLVQALGRLEEFDTLLQPPKAQSIDELKKNEGQIRRRGSI